jgi:hypothetical protein
MKPKADNKRGEHMTFRTVIGRVRHANATIDSAFCAPARHNSPARRGFDPRRFDVATPDPRGRGMARRILRAVAALTVGATLAACSANQHSIFRHQLVRGDQPAITVVDAKQRVILSSPHVIHTAPYYRTLPSGALELVPPSSEEIRRVCTEPSPDVFAVVAQALSTGASWGKSVDPKAIEAALTAAFSSSEQGSTIPRTQTVNMLRELMFRTCERHINGGIGSLELPLQAIRDQRLMVSILAIEQLTGAIAPRPVVIGASAEAAAGASGAEAAVRIDDAYRDLQTKTAAQRKRETEFSELNTDGKDCEQIADAVAKGSEDSLSDALKGKRAKCESAASELAKARTERAESATHYGKLVDAAAGGIPVSAKTALMQPSAPGGFDQAGNEAVTNVALAIREIVAHNFEQDEFKFLCLKLLSPGTDQSKLSDISNACISYLVSGLELERDKNLQLSRELVTTKALRDSAASAYFELFWDKVSTNGTTADAKLVAPLRTRLRRWPTCFVDNGSRAVYQACFNGLVAHNQIILSK